MNNFNNRLMRCLAAALMVFGLSGNAAANGCLSLNATFTSSIGSTTSCADHNMAGCVVGSGGSGCIYTGNTCDFQIVVNPPVGASADKSTSYSVINPGFGNPTCQVKMAITQGNQGANFCLNISPGGVSSDKLTTLGNQGKPVSHKKLEVCTNETFTGEPVVSMEKTVVRVVDNAFNCDDAIDEIDVIAPVDVAFCYTLTNIGQGSLDDIQISDDNGTPLDTSDDFVLLGDGTGLAGGATLVVDSGPVMITEAGERINTATVSGTYQGGQCSSCSDSDTATVDVVVACDPDTQTTANQTGEVVEARDADGVTRCGPAADNPGIASVALLCDGTCDLKDECKASPISCKSPCKPSGNWTSYDEITDQCIFAAPAPGKLPLCQEVLSNPSNTADALCSAIKNPATIRSDGRSQLYSSNPFIYYFPGTSGGGTSTEGTIYCFLYPGEDPSVCPAGSFVY